MPCPRVLLTRAIRLHDSTGTMLASMRLLYWRASELVPAGIQPQPLGKPTLGPLSRAGKVSEPAQVS